MKRWIVLLMVAGFALGTSATVVDEWDMNDNGTWQNSNNGLNLGGHYSSNNQQVVQVPDDGTFFFSPLAASGFGGKTALSSTADLTAGIVKLSWTYTAMNWTNNPAANTQVGFRIWNAAKTDYIALAFVDSADKIFAFAKSSAGLGNLNQKTGRVVNGLFTNNAPVTVSIELDYANGEIRTSSDNWQWNNGFDVHTNAVDFAAAGMTDIGAFQTYYQNWGAGDITTMDNIRIEMVPSEGLYIKEQFTDLISNALATNTLASFDALAGDVVVVVAASNKGTDPSTNSIAFGGSATLDPTAYAGASAGPASRSWHATVTADGTVDIDMAKGDAYWTLGAYLLRSSSGKIDLLDTAKDSGNPRASVTNTYALSSGASGIFIEAFSTYNASGGVAQTVGTVIDKADSGSRRIVAHGEFSDVSSLTNIWTSLPGDKQAVLYGLAFVGLSGTPQEAYEIWIAGYPGVGVKTNLTDDADGDMLDNLGEYAFGGNPSDPADQGSTPVSAQVSAGGTNYLEHVYFERDDAADRGLASILNAGTSLTVPNWSTAGIELVGSGASAVPGYMAVTNRIPTDVEGLQYLRLQVEFTP